MRVSHLSLTDFRSWLQVELPLDPGVTALVGRNGQGKTNLVEAVGYVASLGSHRVGTDAPLVRAGAERAVVRARIERGGRSSLVELELNPGRTNRARLNRSPVPRPREVLGQLRTVLFAPEDLALVRGDPAERRRLLDDTLVARTPRLAGVRADYERVLKQRNALLRTASLARRARGEAGLATLEVWDQHLARTGAELLHARRGLVDALEPHVQQAYAKVSDAAGAPVLAYRSSAGELPAGADRDRLAELLLAALEQVRGQELERGVSLVGPHRDELLLSLDHGGAQPLPVRGYASHGEGWSFALALRLATYALLRADGGDPAAGGDGEPVLVLDDVFAELDEGRRDRLADLVAGAEQVLVTAAVEHDVPAALRGARVEVSDGRVRRVG